MLISPNDEDQLNIGNLTKEMVRNCDSIVETLGLDLSRQVYFSNSRKGDTTSSIVTVLPQPVAEEVMSPPKGSKGLPKEHELSIVRHYGRVDCIKYKIPDDAIAV